MTDTSSKASSLCSYKVNLGLIFQSDSDFEVKCANTAAIALKVLSPAWIRISILNLILND